MIIIGTGYIQYQGRVGDLVGGGAWFGKDPQIWTSKNIVILLSEH